MEPRKLNKLKGLIQQGKTDDTLKLMEEIILSADEDLGQLGKSLAVLINKAYDDFYVDEVHQIYGQLDYAIEGSIAEVIKGWLRPLVEDTLHWINKIEGLDTERRVRELRLATKTKDYAQAVEHMVFLFNKAKKEDARQNMAELLGTALGSLATDQEKVDEVIQLLQKNGDGQHIPLALINKIKERKTTQMEQIFRSRVESGELEWSRALVATTVEFKTYLPAANDLSQIKVEESAKFRRLLNAILRTPFEPDKDYRWFVVLELLIEFCPRQLSYTGQLAGSERRLYVTLGPKAQRLVDETFVNLSLKERLATRLIGICRQSISERYLRNGIEIMGRMKSPLFIDCLLERLRDKKLKIPSSLIISALGESAQPKAVADLIGLLRATTKSPVIDPPRHRQAQQLISALANIYEKADMPATERNEIIAQIRSQVPSKELRLWSFAALNFFAAKVADIQQSHIDWAVEGLVKALWVRELTAPASQAQSQAVIEERAQSPLGERQPLVDALVNIGERGIEALIQAGEEKSLEFSAAFVALAEALEKIGSQKAIPLLERLLSSALAYDETAQKKKPVYEQEYYWDPSDGVKKPLTKDKVVASLVYAIDKIGGEVAEAALMKIYQAIKAGRFAPPGSETARFLMDAAMRVSRKEGKSIFLPQEAAELVEAKEKVAATNGEWTKLSTKKLLKKLKTRRLLKGAAKERSQKVRAIQELTRREEPQAIALIVQHLADTDEMIRTAAHSSLLEFAATSSQAVWNMCCYEIMQALNSKDDKLRTTLANIITEIDPAGKAFKERLQGAIRSDPELLAHKEITKILKFYEEQEKATEGVKQEETGEETPSHISRLEEKRRYLEERRRWIENGKRDEPPKKPEGA